MNAQDCKMTEAHQAQLEFFGECSWCNEVEEGLL